jgi:hypothetical protein
MKELEMLNCDFDLFYWVNNKYRIHLATDGCIINNPPYADYTVAEVISSSKEICADFPILDAEQIVINPNLKNILEIDEELARTICTTVLHKQVKDPITAYITQIYAWSFIRMAQRGFISFDRTKINGNDYLFHWVARPSKDSSDNIRPLPSLDISDFEICINTNTPIQIDI